MTVDIKHYIALAHGVASHAATNTLTIDTAVQFCRVILPALLVEIEIAQRVAERLESTFPVATECDATVCSNRWKKEPAKKAKKAAKKAAKKSRKKNEVTDDHFPS